jgi:hypothetical protein
MRSLTLREKHTLRVLRRILDVRGRKWWEAGEDCINEELCNLFTSPIIIRVIKSRNVRWARHETHMEAMRNAYKILVGKPEWKRPFGRPTHR